MRDLARNKQAIFYKPFTGTEELIDEYGNVTGSFKPTYGNLKSLRLSISANKGDTATQQFGNVLDYDRTMSTSDTSCGIDENSILWLDGADTSKPHNFIVKKVAKSLNAIQYAIKQVMVSETT